MKKTALITSLSVVSVLLISACQSSSNVDVRTGTGSQYKNNGPVPAGYHRVVRGENLYRIGLRYNQSVATLTRWNGLRDASQIEVGQLIRVSRSATGNVASNTSNKTTASKPTGAWSAPSSAVNVGNVRLSRPVSGSVLANFNGGSNKGVDFAGNQGEAIKAAGAGKVVYVGNALRGYGNVVMVQHSQSLLTVYAHNDQIKVSEGEQVKQGQQLATMGSSGADRVKLHFEVRQNGKAVNPNLYW
ncbi:peptidoglycan DD-metalloendopeptidase family protein [Vitreoscilla massiliensis]|uniref:Peptidoglycan DD-metalloendopeptidase family protein n=1 Tax=Vitreoscilla massiliensis TaxID=1689272 RepID=A0ABY4E590_9NEIS|nr:peptidoglycan DD-metalloendopeptidase family protein [Vitreoscilla massiliensis]UOO90931.1 peptidoglycan DD-metalloendopeptidase family protein [Vitreoscilla massiliensis]